MKYKHEEHEETHLSLVWMTKDAGVPPTTPLRSAGPNRTHWSVHWLSDSLLSDSLLSDSLLEKIFVIVVSERLLSY